MNPKIESKKQNRNPNRVKKYMSPLNFTMNQEKFKYALLSNKCRFSLRVQTPKQETWVCDKPVQLSSDKMSNMELFHILQKRMEESEKLKSSFLYLDNGVGTTATIFSGNDLHLPLKTLNHSEQASLKNVLLQVAVNERKLTFELGEVSYMLSSTFGNLGVEIKDNKGNTWTVEEGTSTENYPHLFEIMNNFVNKKAQNFCISFPDFDNIPKDENKAFFKIYTSDCITDLLDFEIELKKTENESVKKDINHKNPEIVKHLQEGKKQVPRKVEQLNDHRGSKLTFWMDNAFYSISKNFEELNIQVLDEKKNMWKYESSLRSDHELEEFYKIFTYFVKYKSRRKYDILFPSFRTLSEDTVRTFIKLQEQFDMYHVNEYKLILKKVDKLTDESYVKFMEKLKPAKNQIVKKKILDAIKEALVKKKSEFKQSVTIAKDKEPLYDDNDDIDNINMQLNDQYEEINKLRYKWFYYIHEWIDFLNFYVKKKHI